MMPDGLYCTVLFPDGEQYWIEPLIGRVPGAGRDDYAVYRGGSVVPGGECGNADGGHIPQIDRPGAADLRGLTEWEARIITDADHEFYLAYGGSTVAGNRMELIINTMNLQYQRDVDIRHVISVSVVRVNPNDPYTAIEPEWMNEQIAAAWSGVFSWVSMILVFTGTDRDLAGTIIGRANAIGSVCNSSHSNCWAWADYNNNFSSATDLCAHELGHLWGGVHCSCSSPRSTMNPVITGINRFGVNPADLSPVTIPAYRNTRGCLQTSSSTINPPNDDCASAVAIEPGTYGFNNRNAVTDGPTVTGCSTGDNLQADIWYTFRAPCDGTLTLSTCPPAGDSSFDTVIAVYTGTCNALVQVACNDDDCGPSPARQSRVSLEAQAGVLYRIRIGGFNGATGDGVLTVDFDSCPPPSNDNCGLASAILVEHGRNYPFHTYGATPSGPLEPEACDGLGDDSLGRDIWFRYIAPCSGTQRISTCGSSFDTRVAVYASCPGNTSGLVLACNDNSCGAGSIVEFTAVANADYYIRVGGYNLAVGVGTLRVDALCCNPLPNDECGGAIPVTLGVNQFSTLCATTSGPAEPDDCAFAGNPEIYRDTWYVFTAPCSGHIRAALCGATHDAEIAIYAACPELPGQVIACNDDSCGLDPQVTWQAEAGASYRIRVGGFSLTAMGAGPLRITIAADWNGDGSINSADISAYLTDWLASLNGNNRMADFDNSNSVNSADISAFLAAWLMALNNGCLS